MESESSAKSLLSLFSSSKLSAFTPPTSRDFYGTTPPPCNTSQANPSLDHDPPPQRKKRRRSANIGEWTCAEIRALESYRNLMKGEDIDNGLREVLLPNRTEGEVKLQLDRIEKKMKEKRGSKLLELRTEEDELFVVEEIQRAVEMEKDYKRRRNELDDILGLAERNRDTTVGEREDEIGSRATESHESRSVKATLDKVLGLVEESQEERRKRELDEALGLR
jgi:hypothetical protein